MKKDYKRIQHAIELFEEAIKLKKDELSIYNLAHIYLYGENRNENVDHSISLLKMSSDKYSPSRFILLIALVKKYKSVSIDDLKNEFKENEKLTELYQQIKNCKLDNHSIFDIYYNANAKVDYLYNILKQYIPSNVFSSQEKKDQNINQNDNKLKKINDLFYEGFEILNDL